MMLTLEDKYQMTTEKHFFDQVKQDFDVYKFYMEFVLKSGIFMFGITGGIVSYYLAHSEKEFMQYSLILPILFNLAFCLICFGGLGAAKELIEDQNRLADKADLMMPYEMAPLKYLLVTFGIVYGILSIGLGVLFVRNIF